MKITWSIFLVLFVLFFGLQITPDSCAGSLCAQHFLSINVGPEFVYLHHVPDRAASYQGRPRNLSQRSRKFALGYRGLFCWTYRFTENTAFQLGMQVARHRQIKTYVYKSWRGTDYVYQRRDELNTAFSIGFLSERFAQPKSAFFRFLLLMGGNSAGKIVTTTTTNDITHGESVETKTKNSPDEDIITFELRFASGLAWNMGKNRLRAGPYVDIGFGTAFAESVRRGQLGLELEVDLFGYW
jgi:hypothetical protein